MRFNLRSKFLSLLGCLSRLPLYRSIFSCAFPCCENYIYTSKIAGVVQLKFDDKHLFVDNSAVHTFKELTFNKTEALLKMLLVVANKQIRFANIPIKPLKVF